MSDADNQATTVLLPNSHVAFYSTDKDTLESAQALSQDWRFARVKIEMIKGGAETAISTYRSVASPDLLVIQTDNIDDGFTAQLEELASHCGENTTAIVIGPVNDVYLYRKLIEMGVSDYLVKPIKKDIIADVIAKTLIERVGATGSRLVAVMGAKGGVGTTTIAQAMAWASADALGQKTLLMDAAGGWSTLGVGMGFEPSTTLAEAAKAAANDDEDSLKRMLFKASEKLSVLASGGDSLLDKAIVADQLEQILTMVMVKYPVVILDLSGAAPSLKHAVINRANKIFVVSTPALPALRLARSLLQEIKEVRGGSEQAMALILNMQGMAPANEVPRGDIEKALELEPSVSLAYNPKVFMSCESEGRKVIDDKEGHDIVYGTLLPLLRGVIEGDFDGADDGEDDSSGGLFGGILTKLKSKG